MNTINIDGQKYPIDSSGAKPEKYYGIGICWKLNDRLNRLDGPALIWDDGTKYWYQNNQLHNLKGPAFISSNGKKSWYIKDKCIGRSDEGFTQKKFEEYLNGKY